MEMITLEEAQNRLPDLVAHLVPGKEILITLADRPVARLIGEPTDKPRPVPGRCAGMLDILSDDDEHLKDWDAYLP